MVLYLAKAVSQLGMVRHTCNPSTWNVEDQEFQVSLGCLVRPCHKTKERWGNFGNRVKIKGLEVGGDPGLSWNSNLIVEQTFQQTSTLRQ
jgi:hypothetical protein